MFTIDPRQAAKVAIPDTGQKTLFLDQSDSVLKTKDDAGVVEVLAVVDATESLVYVALLTQTGTDAPVATVLKNTLGGTVVWSYSGPGDYLATLTGAFPVNKTVTTFENLNWNDSFNNYFNRINDDSCQLYIAALDNFLNGESNTTIKIEVYP